MGWSNPLVPWHELERALSGKPPLPGRGPEDFYGHQRKPLDLHDVSLDDVDAWNNRVREKPAAARHAVKFAELHSHSSFSFLDGASTPEQLVAEGLRLGLSALALTDHDGFYGVVRFSEAAAETDLKTIFGSELSLGLPEPQIGVPDPVGEHLLVLAREQEGYRRLAWQLTSAQLAGKEKGRPVYDLDALAAAADGHWLILTGCRKGSVRRGLAAGGPSVAKQALKSLMERFGRENIAVELSRHGHPTDDEDNDALAELAGALGLPTVATTAAHYAVPRAARLSAAMAAVRARRSLDEADSYLPAGPGAHLRSGVEMARLFARYPDAVPNAVRLGDECAFDLKLVAPSLPPYPVPDGEDENSHLRTLTMRAARHRYGHPDDFPEAYTQIEKELRIIAELKFPGYFLIVHDIVSFCRRVNILCQGRGSAANSAVCYALGITAVDAVKYHLLFERFLAPERDGPPDIDIDIESDRREEVIQYVYDRYGRTFAAQVANVNTFRPKMAVRDMAKAFGHSPGQQDAFSKQLDGWTPLSAQVETLPHTLDIEIPNNVAPDRFRHPMFENAGPVGKPPMKPRHLSIEHEIPSEVIDLALQIQDHPRHLAIHSGGMVIADRPVGEVCPVEWARMENRSVLQWDKDDCAAIGLVKFDLLGLGMLSALHYALDLILRHEGEWIDFASLDLEEAAVYEMLQKADSVGVFQVESRAQMATLPRLKPRTFYDLVVEVALIRPGPIQGGSVHPYIRRRNGDEPVTYDHPVMERSLGKTLGIPLFQEQLMELAIDVAGFDGGEADQLRRAMGSKRSTAKMEKLKHRLYEGMKSEHGITGPIADRIYERLLAFANFGFAESHALSFAALVFYSSWLKLHHPAAFTAALLRAQPMGFYSPQSLVADARRHGVTIRRPDINVSAAEADLEPGPDGRPAIRLGLSGIRTIGSELATEIVDRRPENGYRDIDQLTRAVTLTAAQAEALATSGALDVLTLPGGESSSFGKDRRKALWAAGAAAGPRVGTLDGTTVGLEAPSLPGMSEIELTVADLWSTGITPEAYPTEFSRDRLRQMGVRTVAELASVPHNTRVLVAGMVTHRQRPATASGIIFINLEDETGMLNVVCSMGFWSRYRRVARGSAGLLVRGMLERNGGAFSVLADRAAQIQLIATTPSRDFR